MKGQLDALDVDIDFLLEPPTDTYAKILTGLDVLNGLLDIVGKGSLFLSIFSTYMSLSVTFGQAVQERVKQNKLIGFVWALRVFYLMDVSRGGNRSTLRVNRLRAWNFIRKQQNYVHQLAWASPASPGLVREYIQRGIIDAEKAVNATLEAAKRKARMVLQPYSSKVSMKVWKQTVIKHSHLARLRAMDIVYDHVHAKLPSSFPKLTNGLW